MDGPLIGTHNGTFHADEALAVYMLRMLPLYQQSPLVRTRDPARLSDCHTVVDVGGEYSADANRYDHHQRTFDTTFPGRSTKLSSAGLIYMHFGKAIIAQRSGLSIEDPHVDLIWKKLYAEFIEALDANDNGISVYDSKDTAQLQKRFIDQNITLASLVSDMNWTYEDDKDGQGSSTGGMDHAASTDEPKPSAEDQRFSSASILMGTSFLGKLDYYCKAWLPARSQVREAFLTRKTHDVTGRIMLFEQGCPWKDHVYTIESEEQTDPTETVWYVLYPESSQPNCKWRVQAVSVSKDSFESRKALPEAWRGLRDTELSEKAEIPGCIFVHASGFIGGNSSRDGALAMVKKAIVMT